MSFFIHIPTVGYFIREGTPLHPSAKSKSKQRHVRRALIPLVAGGLVAATGVSPASAAYPTSASVCSSTTNVYAKFCGRIAELTPGSMFAYGTAYEYAGRPSVASVIATVRIWGYGSGGSLRDLGTSYSRSYDMTGVFGRTCSVDVAGGWSGITSGSCQIQGPNWNLTAGNLYAATISWRVVNYATKAVNTYSMTTPWVQAQG